MSYLNNNDGINLKLELNKKKLDDLQHHMCNFDKNDFGIERHTSSVFDEDDGCLWSIKYIFQDENGYTNCDQCDNWSMDEDGTKEAVLNCEWILNNIKQFEETYDEIVIYASVSNENGSDDIHFFTLWNKQEEE